MSYCVNCGVELADYIKKCPLCKTEVLNPNVPYNIEAETPYPKISTNDRKSVSKKSVLSLIAILFMLPTIITLLIDISTTGDVTWSGFVISSILMVYTFISVSMISKEINIAIAELLDITAVILFLMYVNYYTGGNWFITFALPLIGIITLFMLFITVIVRFTRISPLSVISLVLIFSGVITMVLEILIDSNFLDNISLSWSMYPFTSLAIIGMALFYIDKNISLKRKLSKKFFI